ncbi:MAG TPA: hypothetical protein VF132_07345 [Rudaea sp.]
MFDKKMSIKNSTHPKFQHLKSTNATALSAIRTVPTNLDRREGLGK